MSKYLSFQGKILLLAFLFSVVVIEWEDKSFREEICSGIPQRLLESDSELSGSESIEIGEDILVDLDDLFSTLSVADSWVLGRFGPPKNDFIDLWFGSDMARTPETL